MAKTVNDYEKLIKKCLDYAGKYTPALDLNILILAGALQSLEMAIKDIAALDSSFITIGTKNGVVYRQHPAFRVAREAEENCRKQMAELGLTAKGTQADGALDSIAALRDAIRPKTKTRRKIIKPDKD